MLIDRYPEVHRTQNLRSSKISIPKSCFFRKRNEQGITMGLNFGEKKIRNINKQKNCFNMLGSAGILLYSSLIFVSNDMKLKNLSLFSVLSNSLLNFSANKRRIDPAITFGEDIVRKVCGETEWPECTSQTRLIWRRRRRATNWKRIFHFWRKGRTNQW